MHDHAALYSIMLICYIKKTDNATTFSKFSRVRIYNFGWIFQPSAVCFRVRVSFWMTFETRLRGRIT